MEYIIFIAIDNIFKKTKNFHDGMRKFKTVKRLTKRFKKKLKLIALVCSNSLKLRKQIKYTICVK